jgi:membrane fusion protein (multidrug efflux system)
MMGARNVSTGQVIKKDTVLGQLVDLNPVKVEVSVPERFLSLLKLDQTIELRVAAFPGRKFSGQVYFIAPQVDTTTRTALVKAKIANSDGILKPGMFANLDLTLQLRDAAVVVPEPAIMVNADKAMLYAVDKDMNAQLRFVKLGVRSAGLVEILSGVEAGQLVIVEGIQKVRPGAKVKPAGPEATSVYLSKTNAAPANAN